MTKTPKESSLRDTHRALIIDFVSKANWNAYYLFKRAKARSIEYLKLHTIKNGGINSAAFR